MKKNFNQDTNNRSSIMNRNIVLICLDSVRKDIFDQYAPRIQERAEISYNQCRSASTWSVPSHASLFSGELPSQHGVHTYHRDMSDFDNNLINSLPEEYVTTGVSANVFAGPAYGFNSHFDQFLDVPRYQLFPDGLNATTFYQRSEKQGMTLYTDFFRKILTHEAPAKSIINGALAFLKKASMGRTLPDPLDDGAKVIARKARNTIKRTQEPTFLFLNFMEAHAPMSHFHGLKRTIHDAPNDWSSNKYSFWDIVDDPQNYEEFFSNYRQLYNANVEYLDRVISQMIDKISALSRTDTTFVITADHGENLGYKHEDGLFEHKSSLSEGVLHVPLEIVNPPEEEQNVNEYVTHLDLPRLINCLSRNSMVNISRDCIGAEIIGMSAGPEPPNNERYWQRAIRCIYDADVKYEWDSLGTERIFSLNKQKANWQEEDPADSSYSMSKKYFDLPISALSTAGTCADEDNTIDETTKQRLSELGYL